jgi:hypothetical protein
VVDAMSVMQLAQQMMPPLRCGKCEFVVPAGHRDVLPWDALGDSIEVLIRECGQLLPLVMEAENVVKGVFGEACNWVFL